MTKYEALKILQEVVNFNHDHLREHPSIYSIAEALEVICDVILEEPSLPSDLDDVKLVKEQVQEDWYDREIADTTEMDHVNYESIAEHYFNLGKQAGAKWMAGQGVSTDAAVVSYDDGLGLDMPDEDILSGNFNVNDKVIVQIRKK